MADVAHSTTSITGGHTNAVAGVSAGFISKDDQTALNFLKDPGLRIPVIASYSMTAALPANTYANGTAGVGATLTANANGALAAQDGAPAPAVNDVVFVQFEANGSHNGVYVVTQVGDGSHPYILTRHVVADSAAELAGCLVQVTKGSLYGGQSFFLPLYASDIVVGTTALNFQQACGRVTVLATNPASPTAIIIPPGVTALHVEGIRPGAGGGGGGGAGGGSAGGATEAGGGGGGSGASGGSCSSEYVGSLAVTPGHTITLTPGAGGAGGTGAVKPAAGVNGTGGVDGSPGAASTIVDTTAAATLLTTTAGGGGGTHGAGGAAGTTTTPGPARAAGTPAGTKWGTRSGAGQIGVSSGAGGANTGANGGASAGTAATPSIFFNSTTAVAAVGAAAAGTGTGTLGGGGAGAGGGNAGAGDELSATGVAINNTDGQGGLAGAGGNAGGTGADGQSGTQGTAGTYGRGGGGGGSGGGGGAGSGATAGGAGTGGGKGSDGHILVSFVI